MTTPQAIRFPEIITGDFLRTFYNEVLCKLATTTTTDGVTSAQVVAAIAAALAVHNTNPDAHPPLQGEVDETYVYFVGAG